MANILASSMCTERRTHLCIQDQTIHGLLFCPKPLAWRPRRINKYRCHRASSKIELGPALPNPAIVPAPSPGSVVGPAGRVSALGTIVSADVATSVRAQAHEPDQLWRTSSRNRLNSGRTWPKSVRASSKEAQRTGVGKIEN